MVTNAAAVVLAAGKGERMRSALPKVLHAIGGKPMIERVLDAALAAFGRAVVVVLSLIHISEPTRRTQ